LSVLGSFLGRRGVTIFKTPKGQMPPSGGVVVEGCHLFQMLPGSGFSQAAFNLSEVEERPGFLWSQLQALVVTLRSEIEEIVGVIEKP
jgi:hypothetical protein